MKFTGKNFFHVRSELSSPLLELKRKSKQTCSMVVERREILSLNLVTAICRLSLLSRNSARTRGGGRERERKGNFNDQKSKSHFRFVAFLCCFPSRAPLLLVVLLCCEERDLRWKIIEHQLGGSNTPHQTPDEWEKSCHHDCCLEIALSHSLDPTRHNVDPRIFSSLLCSVSLSRSTRRELSRMRRRAQNSSRASARFFFCCDYILL